MDQSDVVDAEWWEPEQDPARLLPELAGPIHLVEFQRARARLAQSVALGDMTRGWRGGRRVSRLTPRLQLVPDTVTERARVTERELVDDIISRPARPCVPLRSI